MSRSLMVVLVAGVLALTGCVEDGKRDAAADPAETVTSSTSNAPSEASEASADVSASTTCQLLAPNVKQGPLFAVATFVQGGKATPSEYQQAVIGVSTVEQLAQSAAPKLADQLTVLAERAQLVLDRAVADEGPDVDLTKFRAAGLEVVRICGPYM